MYTEKPFKILDRIAREEDGSYSIRDPKTGNLIGLVTLSCGTFKIYGNFSIEKLPRVVEYKELNPYG